MSQGLVTLRTKLQTVTGTNIVDVIFDWQEYKVTGRAKNYPYVLWVLDNAKFKKDARSTVIQKTKTISLNCFAITSYDSGSEDKLAVWDLLETYYDVYLNKLNEDSGLEILNIGEIEGELFSQVELDPDKEIGIGFKITLKLYC